MKLIKTQRKNFWGSMKILLLQSGPEKVRKNLAYSLVMQQPEVWRRVSYQDLWQMLKGGVANERNLRRYVLTVLDHIVTTTLMEGKSIIIDAEYLPNDYINKVVEFVRETSGRSDVIVEVKDLPGVENVG